MVGRAVDRWGFRGIKVHWRDGRITREIAESPRPPAAGALRPAGRTGDGGDGARAYPASPGSCRTWSFADDWKPQLAFLDQLARLPNVFTDTSGVRSSTCSPMPPAGRAAQVLFGSDGPFLHPGVELAKVHALGLEPSGRQLVLGGNLCRLVRDVRRAPLSHPSRRSSR